MNARPIVGDENRVAWIGRIILHARRLACGRCSRQSRSSRPVTSWAVSYVTPESNSCNESVDERRWRPSRSYRGRRETCRDLANRSRHGRFHQLHDQTFHDSPDLIEFKSATALGVFRIFGFLKNAMQHYSRRGADHRRSPQCEPPIDSPVLQRFGLRADAGSNTSSSVPRAFSSLSEMLPGRDHRKIRSNDSQPDPRR